MVLLSDKLLANIRHTQRIEAVVLRGEYLDRERLDELMAREGAGVE